jgi:hypothetical protein
MIDLKNVLHSISSTALFALVSNCVLSFGGVRFNDPATDFMNHISVNNGAVPVE